MPELILASTSRYRRELLERLRLPFRCVAPEVDEEAEQAKKKYRNNPLQLAVDLARMKAAQVAITAPGAVVIGSDQVCSCMGMVLNKPGTVEKAREQLGLLNFKWHELTTAVCIMRGDMNWTWFIESRLYMRPLTNDEIERYIAADEPLDCAGSYKLESLGIGLFETIQTQDYTAIVGLPLILVSKHLRDIGFAIP